MANNTPSPRAAPGIRNGKALMEWIDHALDWAESKSVPMCVCRDHDGYFLIITVRGVGEVTVQAPDSATLRGKHRVDVLERLPKRLSNAIGTARAELMLKTNGKVLYGHA